MQWKDYEELPELKDTLTKENHCSICGHPGKLNFKPRLEVVFLTLLMLTGLLVFHVY